MIKIQKVFAKEIFDSRGTPTLAVAVSAGDFSATFAVPSGASTGSNEALELRDGDKKYHNGKGVNYAISNVNGPINDALVGLDVLDQRSIDKTMMKVDGTPDKSHLGANAMIGVSVAVAKTAALARKLPTFKYLRSLADIKSSQKAPFLYMNLINGGMHAKTCLAFQEYHVVPETEDVNKAFTMGAAIQNKLRKAVAIEIDSENIPIGDEGGLAPDILSVRKPLELLTQAIEWAGYTGQVRLALDVAASSFFKDGKYFVEGKYITQDELLAIYDDLIKEFNLISIEDPFDEEDFAGFAKLLAKHPHLRVVGDDLTTTSKELLAKAVSSKSVNAMIIKPNQIGTLSETLDTMKFARENKVDCIVSHRSGETNDDFIADLSFAFGCFGLKAGAPLKKERAVKYQRLVEISKMSASSR